MDASEVQRIGNLVSQGVSLRAVAVAVGLGKSTVHARLVAAGDRWPRRRRKPLSGRDRARIVSMAESGEPSLNRIAGAVERSWHTVRRILESERVPRQTIRYRCPRCGYLVQVVPCQICEARKQTDQYVRSHNADAS